MSSYDPKNLPEISAIRILKLGDLIKSVQIDYNDFDRFFTLARDHKDRDSEHIFTVLKSVFIAGKNINSICDLWYRLPEAKQARCHIPVFGLHLMVGPHIQIHTRASICWQCNNILVSEKDEHKSFGFDSRSEAGQELFRLLTAYTEDV